MIPEIKIINDSFIKDTYVVFSDADNLKIVLNIFNLDNFNLFIQISKIKATLSTYSNIKEYKLIFYENIDTLTKNKIVSKISDVLYTFNPKSKPVSIINADAETKDLYIEIEKFKNIVMLPPPEKNNINYLTYILNNLSNKYKNRVYDISGKDRNLFPLSFFVNKASIQPAFFIHIYPDEIKPDSKNLLLIGKAVTFDTGGINIKTALLEELKIDMTGSAMLLSVLNLLSQTKNDNNLNIHLLIPIVVNDIGENAYLPGSVLEATNKKTIEVINTDAEGRLTIVDSLNFINLFLIKEFNIDTKNTLILDVATLTGNVSAITGNYSAVIINNDKASELSKLLIDVGNQTGEYLQNIDLRPEVLINLRTPNADIANIATSLISNCLVGGVFLNFFCDNEIPWIHIDIGITTYKNRVQTSYGINLLFEFFKKLNFSNN